MLPLPGPSPPLHNRWAQPLKRRMTHHPGNTPERRSQPLLKPVGVPLGGTPHHP
ncbi:hypothetical protein T484DRAFT_1934356 [Baffinella frigidus]|nr:hypothetical protein T484DRAFT_1934356 [Cryptophyta sp. CCMP2293]